MADTTDHAKADDTRNIYKFKDDPVIPDPIHDYPDSLNKSKVPLIIDNGSFKCRAGFANSDEPTLVFKNVIAKQRAKKDSDVQIGNDISNIEVVRWQLKSPYDRNVVTQYDSQEQIFDYIFSHLGINTSGSIDHPIVLTEAVCNPNFSRKHMSELLFECYHVPSVAYGVDALFSLYNNHPNIDSANALLVSCGYQTTHILPVLQGRLDARFCRRINIGGAHLDMFMQRLLQLKHPGHYAAVSLTRAEELVRDHSYMAEAYFDELEKWGNEDYYVQNVHKIQLPNVPVQQTPLNPEQQKERKIEQGKRLKEINARRREEKLAADQEKLMSLLSIQEILDDDGEEGNQRALESVSCSSRTELLQEINKLNNSINRLNNKILSEQTEEPLSQEKNQKEIKRKKGEQPGAGQAKKPKDERKGLEILQTVPSDPKELEKWLTDIRRKRQELLDVREKRKQRRADMAKRRTFASQQRMKMITELAQGGKKKKDDNFGQNDEDWNVYKAINKDGGDSDSEAELEQIEELETALKDHDPSYKDPDQQGDSEYDITEYYRLHLATERIRVPELVFQPSMIGMEQAGITETMDFILKKYSPEMQDKLTQYVFLTGGCASFSNFKERIERDLLSIRPFQSIFSIHTAKNPVHDAWLGARKWALSPALGSYSITKKDYDEMGMEYLKEHVASNVYFPSPKQTQTETNSQGDL